MPSPPHDDRPAADRESERTGASAALNTPVEELPGVTPPRADQLARLELYTARDLLFFFPRDYHDLTDVRPIADLEEGLLLSVVGTVEDVDARRLRHGRTMVAVLIRQGNDPLRGLWFNQSYMRSRFAVGQRVMFSGKPSRRSGRWEITHPRVQWLSDDEEEEEVTGRLLPVYPLTEGLKQRHVRWLMRAVIERFVPAVEEVFPPAFLAEHNLWPIGRALPAIHAPATREDLTEARRRFVYQELFVLQLGLAIKRQQLRDLARAPTMPYSARIDARIRKLIPFKLTDGQEAALAEIRDDLAHAHPMHRLLQGDVGTGKTVLAVYAMLWAVAHGYQAVLMAPTEILARQHAATIDKLLEHSQVRRAVLTGGMPARERQELLATCARGDVDVIVGTQAVVQADVNFARLGLVVIDEQHKFGVRQRALLKGSGSSAGDSLALLEATRAAQAAAMGGSAEAAGETSAEESSTPARVPMHFQQGLFAAETEPSDGGPPTQPHYLVMTATPIPRTITMSLFGDLDVSTLRDAPPGRQPIHTYWAPPDKRTRWWTFFRNKLLEGRQGYVVLPLVEGSEDNDSPNVMAAYKELSEGELSGVRLAMLHGRMSPADKQEVMRRFRTREIEVLITTTVIEVGVDVPNATLMTIEQGDRFGLAQLHQLRGRVTRGKFPGYCCVFADTETEDASQRIEAFVGSTDGFELAEADFRIRGPGELFGTRQHGMPPFRIADLVRDAEILEQARGDAMALVEGDAGLARPEHQRLRRMVLARYGRVLDLGAVG